MKRPLGTVLWVLLAVTGCGPGRPGRDVGVRVDAPASNVDAPTARPDAPVPSAELRIEPATATIDLAAGATPTAAFVLFRRMPDGTEVPVPTASWSIDRAAMGTIAGGVFTASGDAAGTGQITARDATGFAVARIEVRVSRTIVGTGVPTDVESRFGPPVAGPGSPRIVYPLEGAFMPRNVQPADVQWELLGVRGDVFRLRLTRPHAVVTVFDVHTGVAIATASWWTGRPGSSCSRATSTSRW